MDFSAFQKILIRNILKKYLENKARIKGEVFRCNALEGESAYDISINSDMTVSCNAQDYNGSGHIGDLNKSSLKEIFEGKIVNDFRKKLDEGKLPLIICARCPELVSAKKNKIKNKKNTVPSEGIMIENTVACDMMCKSCERETLLGCRKKISLSLNDLEKIAKEVLENKIKSVCFFNLGEPFLSKNIYQELEILKKHNKKLHIIVSTNGLHLDTDEKRKAIKYINHIAFSIDGVNNKILRKYQTNGNFETSYGNMKALVDYRNKNNLGGVIEWKYVLFNWNDKKVYIDQAIKLAKEAGVNKITFWPTGNPLWGISWRYYVKSYFKKFGLKNSKGVIEVNL